MANYLLGEDDTTQEEKPLGTAGDFAKTLGVGAAAVGSNLAGGARYLAGNREDVAGLAKGIQDIFLAGGEAISDTINPETKKLASAALTSPEFWDHPILSTALKTTGMLPAVAAMAIPGGLLADAVGATLVAAGSGAAINAGAGLDEFYKKLDAMSDKELQDQSPKYSALRGMMDEKAARVRFNKEAQGWGPALNAVIGAAATAVGPAGVAARGLAGGTKSAVLGATEESAAARAGLGAAEGAIGNAVQGGVSDVTSQQAEIEAGMQKEFDTARAANAALEGGALGGLLGGAVGLVAGGGAHKGATDSVPKVSDTVSPTVATADATAPQVKNGSANAPVAKPVESAAIGNPQNAPTRSKRDLAKDTKSKAVPKEAEAVPAPLAPDPAIVAAIAMNDKAPTAQPTEHAAMTQRSPNATLDILDKEGQPPGATPAPVPLDTGVNVPEAPQSLPEQLKQIGTGSRKAVMVPKGTVVPATNVPTGMKRTNTPRGSFIYDPKLTNPTEIRKLSAAGRENELLGLGPVPKPQAVADAAAGATPVAITERTPQGTEVKAAAGTTATLPEQRASLEAQKTPGNVVVVETPEQVLKARIDADNARKEAEGIARAGAAVQEQLAARNKSVLERATAETVPLSDFNVNKVEAPKEAQGKRYSEKERAAKEEKLAKAQKIYDETAPGADEEGYMRPGGTAARDAIIKRAQTMVERAEKEGVKVQAQLKKSVKGDAASDAPAIQVLRLAKDLAKVAAKRKAGREITEATGKFAEAERLVRGGYSEEVIAQRRAEGDAAMRRTSQDAEPESKQGRAVNLDAGTEVTPEGITRAKAASGEKLTPEAKAKMIAEMNAKLAPAKVKNDALVVDRNPTEAQKKAGNYKKGHIKVDGLDVTLENPRGAIRRGVDEHGEPWQVRMPDHYGYIRRTEGADGDHVDAYVGKSGKRHFVIDQLDHRTGEFDEHKVMLNYKDEAAATDAYRRGFSDGKGDARLGNIHELSAAELKEWLKHGDTTEPHTMHALDRVNFDVPEGPPRRPITALQALDKVDFSKATGVNSVLAKFFASRFKKLAANVDVMHISDEAMADMGYPKASGLHVRNVDTGRSEIYIPQKTINRGMGTDYGSYGHTLLHELTHAVTVREIETVPGARAAIGKLAAAAGRYIGDPQNHWKLQLEFGDKLQYGFKNAKEFIAEAFSNPHFQEVLSRIPIDADTAAHFGLRRGSMSMWDMFRNFVKQAIEKATGKLPQFDSVLDGIMKVGEHLTKIHEAENIHLTGKPSEAPRIVNAEALRIVDDAKEQVTKWLGRPENNTTESAPKALKLRTFDNIAQIADHYFGENNPVRRIHEAIERTRITGDKLFEKVGPLASKMAAARAKDRAGYEEFAKLQTDSTLANLHPDVSLSDAKNAHLGKNKVVGSAVWQKAQHSELAKRYNMLSPEFKELWHESGKYYADTQNKMTKSIIENQLELLGKSDAALADRIHIGTVTDADRTSLGRNLDLIEAASELSKIEGYFVPLMRRGDHVVKADMKVTQPGNSKKISGNEFEFTTDKEATDYAKSSSLQATIKKVWVDEKTGELHQTDPATGKEHRMSAEDLDSVARYRVEVHNRHVEFVQGKRAAEARAAELAQDNTFEVHKVVPRAFEPGGRQAAELSTALSNLVKKLEKSDAYKQATPTQQATMRAAIGEASLASHGSTRVSSRALPRRGVKGYSEDAVQGLVDYGASSSRYLAKLEHGPDLEAGLKDMQAQLDRDHSKTGQYARTAISNEVRGRVEGDNGFQQGGVLAPVVKRLLSLSFIDKLGSPAYSVINAMQPGMVTVPYLAGRHGVGRTFAALGKAYADINAARIVKQGIKETGRRFAGKRAPEDFMSSITKNLSPDEKAMIDEHVKVGTLDPSAGMEIGEINRDYKGIGGKADAVLGYLEGVTREMPRAIEAVNRAVTALGAYRLERSRGATHDAAVTYSKDAVNNTQFNYSPTNTPTVFNHPLLKIALQFKKYGQGMYQLIGSQVANAIRNEKPGDRAQAVKTLIGIAATHTAIAGALGLPTEPFKYLLMSAHAIGLTGMTWSDVEDKIRHQAANVFGKTGGEVFSRGLPRLLNLDLSRAGLDSITSFGEPRSQKEADVKTWLFDSLSGPVVSLGGDWIKGVNNIANGNFEKAAEQMIPLKAAADALRAYRQSSEGKKSATGKQTMTPYTPTEAALRVLGFGSGREAEVGAATGAFYRQSQAQKEARTGLVNAWVQAAPADKSKSWAAIQKWNKEQPAEVKIAPKELTDKVKRDTKSAASSPYGGIVPNKRDKRFLNEGAIYNTR
jgi:hypothetical protein